MPLVSIGMPVFNDIRFLRKALNSILAQSFNDFELIISDDCSSDGSDVVCKEYAALDLRIKYIRQTKNIGISKNMEFLIKNATGKYFMWAGNDDIWDVQFIETLLKGFENSVDTISVFCPMYFIDEDDKMIINPGIISTDYHASTAYERLKKLVLKFDDAFGYGIFIREKIVDVKFPVWWWLNKKCAYNNIYPTLCYYLSKGNFSLIGEKPLWFNRLKNEKYVNHKIPYNQTFIRGFALFILRKINLIVSSLSNIIKAEKGLYTSVKIFPLMLYHWVLVPSYNEFKRRCLGSFKGKLSFW